MNEMSRYMANPRTYTLKRWLAEILKDKYPKHDGIIERVGTSIVTEKDMQDFGSMITEVYELAYRKAVSDYREEFEKLGVKVSVVADEPSH